MNMSFEQFLEFLATIYWLFILGATAFGYHKTMKRKELIQDKYGWKLYKRIFGEELQKINGAFGFIIFVFLFMSLLENAFLVHYLILPIISVLADASGEASERLEDTLERVREKPQTQQHYNDFDYQETVSHDNAQFEFNSSRFKSSKEQAMYEKWANMVNDPNAAPNEREFCLRRMIAADKGQVEGIKALPPA